MLKLERDHTKQEVEEAPSHLSFYPSSITYLQDKINDLKHNYIQPPKKCIPTKPIGSYNQNKNPCIIQQVIAAIHPVLPTNPRNLNQRNLPSSHLTKVKIYEIKHPKETNVSFLKTIKIIDIQY